MSSLVELSREEGGKVVVLTLNNPAKLNALTGDMGDQLTEKVQEVQESSEVRAVILTGAGKAFSAGGDLDWLMARHRDTQHNNVNVMKAFYSKFLVIRSLAVPVIAAINGPAVGAGFCLALGADLRVAHSKAAMGLTFTKLGLHPGMAATHFLPLLAGPQVASDLLLTGRLITGTEASGLGLVARVGEDCQLLARELAAGVCDAGPTATRTLLATLREGQERGLQEAFHREATAQAICYQTRDFAEGVQALQERRKPEFRGN